MRVREADRPFNDPRWAFEIKYAGCRCLAEWSADGARLHGREGEDVSSWFVEVTGMLAFLGGRRCVVDGVICVLNQRGVAGAPERPRLERRLARRGFRAGDDTVAYCVFDALVIAGKSVMHLPLLERKRLMRPLLAGATHVVTVADIVGDGEAMYRMALELELEGIVAKKLDAPYQPGVRSSDWLKIAARPG